MPDQEHENYRRISEAIVYINANFKDQPSLEEIASAVSLSPFYFQRLFMNWAGVSQKFMQYISVEYAKDLLQNQQSTLLSAAHEIGLSGTSRLHDLFINIEGMTPGEFKTAARVLR